MIRRLMYRVYLKTPHWGRVRARALRKFPRCARCGSVRRLEVHHKTYVDASGRSVLWHESLRDLEVLCHICHNKAHGLRYNGRAR